MELEKQAPFSIPVCSLEETTYLLLSLTPSPSLPPSLPRTNTVPLSKCTRTSPTTPTAFDTRARSKQPHPP